MSRKAKIGVGITTYNSPEYFHALYQSLPLDRIDELVIVNGGEPYSGEYEGHWIQHESRQYASVARNDAVEHLMKQGCDHIFLIEDDMIILDPTIFEKYIEVSERTGLQYLAYVSTSDGSGTVGNRNVAKIVDYPNGAKVHLYPNMCNEFTYHHSDVFESLGTLGNRPYDENMRDAFDVDLAFRESVMPHSSPFWHFADIPNSDSLIQNNPVAVSRLQANGGRESTIAKTFAYFQSKHGIGISQIPKADENQVKTRLKNCYEYRKLPPYDVFIPCAPKDMLKLPYVVESIRKYLNAENIFVCAPSFDEDVGAQLPGVTWVLDEEILPNIDFYRSVATFRPNWTLQQFLKMFQTHTPNDYFLTVDADTIFCRPLHLFTKSDQPIWYYGKDQFHEPYFRFMQNEFNVKRYLTHTAIGDIGFFRKSWVAELLSKTRFHHVADIIESTMFELTPAYHFSEFETYGNFAIDRYFFRRLSEETQGKKLFQNEPNWTDEEISEYVGHFDGKVDVLHLHSWKI